MKFSTSYERQPEKFLKKLQAKDAVRMIDKIEDVLCENPVPHDAKVIVGQHGVFRIRVGDFRILYRIDYDKLAIIVIAIDKRERVY